MLNGVLCGTMSQCYNIIVQGYWCLLSGVLCGTMLQYYGPGILVPAKWANQDTSGRERPPNGLPNISPDIREQRKYEIFFPKPLENEWT